jgi:hypothetical protein
MQIGAILGLVGDLFTFMGAVILAFDAISKQREYLRLKNIESTIQSKALSNLTLELDGVLIKDKDDVARAFVHTSAGKTVVGCLVLMTGFLFLLFSRLLDYLSVRG